MRTHSLLLLALLPCPACLVPAVEGQVGYTRLHIRGGAALSPPGGSVSGADEQDIESAFGLGDDQGSVYARVAADLGTPQLSLSAFTFDESGRGTLSQQYGNIPAGTAVDSDVGMVNVKGAIAFAFDLGVVSLAPGVAFEVFDLDVNVQDTFGLLTERIDVLAPVPMAYLRADVDLAVVGGVAELGYIEVPDINDIDGRFWDVELRAEVRPTPFVHLFAGYRHIGIDGDGTAEDREFSLDLEVSGWMVGGGVRF